ncbi:MAG: hypothetical protein ABW032_06335 [Burkholderiaceae bacterium]
MAENEAAPAPPAAQPGWAGSLTRAVAVAGSLVALGQSASTWIDGHYHSEMEREKTTRELQLADLKERSALAESYLKLILAKDTPEDGRAILYSALGQLKGHPLQQWAQARFETYQQAQARLKLALDDQAAAAGRAKDSQSGVVALKADIQTLNVRIVEAMDNPSVVNELQRQRVEKSAALALAEAQLSLTRLASAQAGVAGAGQPAGGQAAAAPGAVPSPAESVARIESITRRVNADLLKPLFPAGAAPGIDSNAPYLRAALQEFNISDPKLVAAIIATIAVEAPSFGAYEGSASAAQAYEGRLGNVQPGDGVKYRDRGYIGLTGRANYQRISEQLGLGTRLVDSPDDAKSPEVASRVLVAWFSERRSAFTKALESGDFATARKLVAGGPTQVPKFEAVYRRALQGLTGSDGKPASAAAG